MKSQSLCVADLMSDEVVTFRFDDALVLADDIMRLGRIRHLPVVADDGRTVIGILSQRDLFRHALSRSLGFDDLKPGKAENVLVIGDIMTREIKTICPGEPAARAAKIMLIEKIGCMPVVKDGGRVLVGILTESDFVRHVGKQCSDAGSDTDRQR